jgi:predicted TIM-barrel fold metal-dependent hydrolase
MTAVANASRPRLVVDGHLHVWSTDTARYPIAPGSRFAPTVRGEAAYLRELMEASGVDRAVIVQPSCYGEDHRCVRDALRDHPGVFAAACLVDPLAPDAPDRLAARHAEGFRGLRLNPSTGDGAWLDDPRTAPLWDRAAERRTIISFLILPHQLSRAAATIARYPQVPVIIDHLGRPRAGTGEPAQVYADTLTLAGYPNVYLKISGLPVSSQQDYPYRDVWPFVQLALEHFGRQRCMWATDFPWITQQCGYDRCLRLITDELDFLTDEDRRWLLGETATRLWGFGVTRDE